MDGESLWRCEEGTLSLPAGTPAARLSACPSACHKCPPPPPHPPTPYSAYRFENMVNALYGEGEVGAGGAAELEGADETADGDGAERPQSVVRTWSFLEDSDDDVSVACRSLVSPSPVLTPAAAFCNPPHAPSRFRLRIRRRSQIRGQTQKTSKRFRPS